MCLGIEVLRYGAVNALREELGCRVTAQRVLGCLRSIAETTISGRLTLDQQEVPELIQVHEDRGNRQRGTKQWHALLGKHCQSGTHHGHVTLPQPPPSPPPVITIISIMTPAPPATPTTVLTSTPPSPSSPATTPQSLLLLLKLRVS